MNFAKVVDIKAGDMLRPDDGFECLSSERLYEVKFDAQCSAPAGLYIECKKAVIILIVSWMMMESSMLD